MPHRLRAIEIAEGALLADVAIVLQLIAVYLPIGGEALRVLIPTAFAIIVLRRGFYVGLISLAVAIFVIGIMTGLHFMSVTLLECGSGLFLGLAMRLRMRAVPIVLLGTTAATILTCALIAFLGLITGFPVAAVILQLRATLAAGLAIAGLVAHAVGLGAAWQAHLPALRHLAALALTYWWALWVAGIWVILLPVVIVVAAVTTFLVRMLGYDVRPFPGGLIARVGRRVRRVLLRQAVRRGLTRKVRALA